MHCVNTRSCLVFRVFVLLICAIGMMPLQAETVALTFKHKPELVERLQQALQDKGKNYVPRTEHLDAQKQPLYTNRLILEDSPYLIQHAHNPVDWYPWDAEAFAKAKKENKPQF